MELLKFVENKQLKSTLPQIKPGNIVAVHQRIKEGAKERIQIFKGIVIRVKGGYGINGSFTVRKIASGVGVEKTYLFNSPLVEKIEVLKTAKVRRSKLYYLRGRDGKAARLNVTGDEKGVKDLVREIAGEVPVEAELKEDTKVEKAEAIEKDDKKVAEKVENKVEEKKEEKPEVKAEKKEKVEKEAEVKEKPKKESKKEDK
jgi:large subunit ribosomal protein L19